MVQTSESVDDSKRVAIQLKATEQYFLVVQIIMLNKMVLTFESAKEIRKCEFQ